MPNSRFTVTTVCPYFIRETGNAIYCEGVIPGSTTISRFASREVKTDFQEAVCSCFRYESRCPLAQEIEKKY